MSLLMFFILFVLILGGAWLLITYFAKTPALRNTVIVVAVILLALLTLKATGLSDKVSDVKVPRMD